MWTTLTVVVVATLFQGTQGQSVLDCDFENETLCGYKIEENQTPGLFDVMEWRWGESIEKQKYYDIKLLAFGPDGDHTSGTPEGHFMYAVRPINPHTTTFLISPSSRGRLCYLEFYYHMGSRSLNSLNAYVIKYGERIKLWSVEGYQSRDWERALIDIEIYTEFGAYQIAIEATEPSDAYWTVGYAIDDIKGIGCNMPIDCDFEVDMCNLEVERNSSVFDPMQWHRGKTQTKTWFGVIDTVRFGPKADHTTKTTDGYFAYTLRSLAAESTTAIVSPKQLDPMCHVTFWYYMNVSTLTSLEFHVRDFAGDNMVWNVSGSHGPQWNYMQLSIENRTRAGSYELVWRAAEPSDGFWGVGYTLDDIKTYKCECESYPCQNGGFCINEFNTHTCHCPQYYKGQNCEINTNPCRDYPCMNLAFCIPQGNNYTCSCWPGWTGQNCETDIDDCATSPCKRGTCVDHLYGFTCECPSGYEGAKCELEINDCDSGPCQNGANCTHSFNSYKCSCQPGFTGKQCEVNIDECASSPCQHGGFCFDQINHFICVCHPEYAGYFCEIREEMDCDFEVNFCGYTASTTDTTHDNDTFQWVHGKVSKPGFFGSSRILFMGPHGDHTSGQVDGSAAYAKRGKDANATASMISPLMEGRLCYLEFFYHMGTSSLNDLNVYMIKGSKKTRVFTTKGYQGFEWQRAMVDIEPFTEKGRYQVQFEVDEPAQNGYANTGYAIDDIKGFNCDLDVDCDFENGTCNYIIERDDNYFDRMEWRRGQSVLETMFADIKLLRNGPKDDHTTNTTKGFFMYAVRPINSGTNTTLVAPRQRDPMCFLQFFYHMGSHYLNTMVVSIRGESETYEVFNATGYQGDGWKKAVINIEKETRVGKYEIAIFVNEPSDKVWTVGYAIDDITASPCLCDNKPCMNNANCTNTYFGYKCDCPYPYTGTHCEKMLTPCEYTPCANGGTCTNLKDKYSVKPGSTATKLMNHYSCQCTQGWTGKDCDVDIDECESDPCQNGGKCNDHLNGYTCDCAPGWMGTLCTENVNECLSNPCQNQGKCKDEIDFFECECEPGYFGAYCQFEIDECSSFPCINGGTCVDDVNFYSCICPAGYAGINCEVDIDECVSSPCQNDGMCVDMVDRYDCYCKPGFSDINCNVNVNECWSNPCRNGATCNDLNNMYNCTCVTGYVGAHCETDLDECLSSPCRNGGTCRNLVGKFHCDCPLHWTGDMCQKSLSDCGTDPC